MTDAGDDELEPTEPPAGPVADPADEPDEPDQADRPDDAASPVDEQDEAGEPEPVAPPAVVDEAPGAPGDAPQDATGAPGAADDAPAGKPPPDHAPADDAPADDAPDAESLVVAAPAVPISPAEAALPETKRERAKAAKAAAKAEPKRVPSYRKRRSWPQRLLLVFNLLLVIVCFATAGVLVLGRHIGNSIAKVDIPATSPNNPGSTTPSAGLTTTSASVTGTTVAGQTLPPTSPGPTETFPIADPKAQNFLITGADNDACIDPSSPYAGAFGDRSSMGERSDTIMVMRVDPSTNRAAMLSFPRDLYVNIPGRGKQRINAAYTKNDPTTLIKTLDSNFGVKVDHFIQIDFCAFKTIIDHIPGGVGVPFELPARDNNTGLYVAEPGCAYFTGDEALAYVRSRHYQYYKNNRWHAEGLSDIARIARQQDFIRRVIQTALNKGLLTPSILRGLIDAATNNVVVDSNLTLQSMLSFAGVLRQVQAAGIPSYQIEATGKTVNNAAVLIPNLNSQNMKAILKVFKGQAPLAEAPVQTVPVSVADTGVVVPDTGTADTGAPLPTLPPTTTVPGATGPEENTQGIVPPRDQVCP